MRIVLDTNTIVSAILIKDSIPAKLFDIVIEEHILLASEKTIEELAVVILRSKFDKYVSLEKRRAFLTAYINATELIKTSSLIELSRDATDNKFLELAIDGLADYLITGDKDLLDIKANANFKILKPADFLNLEIKH